MPIKWSTTAAGSADSTFAEMFSAINHSFGRWENVSFANIRFSYQGNVTSYVGNDGVNLVAFDENGSLLAMGPSTLATTQFFISVSTGRLLDADIIFNGKSFTFSTTGNNYDIESIATHEIGHLIGLDHAIIGTETDTASRPTMTPYYSGLDGRTLEQDDRAGVGVIYPGTIFLTTGNISGNIRNEHEIFGAYVAALNASTNKPVIAVFTGYHTGKGIEGEGDYQMLGLETGVYTLKVTPMDGFNGITSSNFNGIFSTTFTQGFRTQFYNNMFHQGIARNITIEPNTAFVASFNGVIAQVNISLSPDQTVPVGNDARYSVFVGNTGNDNDNFTLAIVSNSDANAGVNATFNQTFFSNVADGEKRTALLIVHSTLARMNTITLNVTSQANASAGTSATVVTTVITNLSVSLISPQNNSFSASSVPNFICNATGGPLQSMTLFYYGVNSNNSDTIDNTSTQIRGNTSTILSGTINKTQFTLSLPDGRLLWSCTATDSLGNTAFADTFTFTIDTHTPAVHYISLNASYLKPNSPILVTVNATDAVTNVSAVFVTAISATSLSGNSTPLVRRERSGAFFGGSIFSNSIQGQSTRGSHTLSVVTSDSLNNTVTNLTSYVVDADNPTITPYVPVGPIRAYNATFIWQVEDNLSSTSLTVDGLLQAVPIINKTMDVQNFSATITGLRSGMHEMSITATDNASNSARITFTFSLFHEENLTEMVQRLLTAGRGQLTNITYSDILGNLLSGAISANQTIIKDFVINSSLVGVNASVTITAFGENYDETKASSVSVEANRRSALASMVGSHLGGDPPRAIVLFQNMSHYVTTYSLQNGTSTFVTLTFKQLLGSLLPFYVADDDGTSVYLLSRCANNSPPTGTPSLSTMCYTNSTTSVILYVPHLSGGGLDDPANAPAIKLTTPTTVIDNSFFTAHGTIQDLNLDTTSCDYTITKSITTNSNSNAIATTGRFTPTQITSTNYTFSIGELTDLANGTSYNFTVSCASTDTNRTTLLRQFIVADTTPPKTTSITISGITSSRSTGTLTAVFATDETAVCGYNSTAPTSLLSSFLQADTTLSSVDNNGRIDNKTHTYSKTYTADGTVVVPSVVCVDLNGNSQTQGNESFSVMVNVEKPRVFAADGGGGRGGGGGGGGKATAKVNSPAKITKVAANIAKGQTAVLSMITKEVALTQIAFTATEFIPKLTVIAIRLVDIPGVPELHDLVYEYLNITTTPRINASDIRLELRVAKEWLTANKVDTLGFYLLENEIWQQIPLSKTGESDVQVTYTAKTPHLSLFALAGVTGKNKQKEEQSKEKKEKQSDDAVTRNQTEQTEQGAKKELPFPGQIKQGNENGTTQVPMAMHLATLLSSPKLPSYKLLFIVLIVALVITLLIHMVHGPMHKPLRAQRRK